MPPKGRPSSSHSSRPSRSSHSSHASHSSHSSHRSSGFGGSHRYRHSSSGYGGYRSGSRRSYGSGGGNGCVSVFIVLAIIVVLAGVVYVYQNQNRPETGSQQSSYSEQHDAIYVSALGRDVPWNSEYDSYYDKQTDCYFILNTDMDPPIWQYWFEGISSDYGDYGWLEWDAKEEGWYVQTGYDKWEVLPEGKGSDLWHFD